MEYYLYTGVERVSLGNWRPHVPQRGDNLSYGDFEHCKHPAGHKPRELYLIPSILSGSDYTGESVNQSNHRVFLNTYGKWTGIHHLCGGYGTYAVAIRSDVLTRHPEVQETLDSLEDDPVMDESDLSELEHEEEEEAWNSYVESDLISAVRKSDPRLEEFDPDTIDWYDLYIEAMEETNTYWEHSSEGAYLPIDDLVPNLSEMVLVRTLTPQELSLEISRTWKSEKARSEFESILKYGRNIPWDTTKAERAEMTKLLEETTT